jgi:hypothetical protein
MYVSFPLWELLNRMDFMKLDGKVLAVNITASSIRGSFAFGAD